MIDKADGEVSDMGAVENAELVRGGYEAFIAGDLATLGELFAEDAAWSVPGSGALSGTKRGRDAILAYFEELGARSQGSLQVTVQDIVGGEKHTVGIHHSHAETNGKIYDQTTVLVFVLRDGKAIEVREYFEDTAKADEFWVCFRLSAGMPAALTAFTRLRWLATDCSRINRRHIWRVACRQILVLPW